MPSKSAKQHRLMEYIAHGGSVRNGPTKAVAQEFVQADKGRHWLKEYIARGGTIMDGPTTAGAREFLQADKGHRFVPHPKRERK